MTSQLLQQIAARSNAYRTLLKGKVTVLTYHRVLPEDDLTAEDISWEMAVTKPVFCEHLKFLHDEFVVIDEEQLVRFLDGEDRLRPDRAYVAITFDDGWRDNFDHAFDLLRQTKTPATIFLCTAHIDNGAPFWWAALEQGVKQFGIDETRRQLQIIANQDSEPVSSPWATPDDVPTLRSLTAVLKQMPADKLTNLITHWIVAYMSETTRTVMTWEEVSEMARASIKFGPHTRHHTILPGLSLEQQREEVEGCAADLAARGLDTSAFFCFPSGEVDEASTQVVQAAGFDYAYGLGGAAFSPKNYSRPSVIPRLNVGMHNSGSLGAFKWALTKAGIRAHRQRAPQSGRA